MWIIVVSLPIGPIRTVRAQPITVDDCDFLLSLLDSQVAGDDFETWWDEYQRPWLPNGVAGYEHAKKAWAAAATRMRQACVGKVRAKAETHDRPWARQALKEAAHELESLELEQ